MPRTRSISVFSFTSSSSTASSSPIGGVGGGCTSDSSSSSSSDMDDDPVDYHNKSRRLKPKAKHPKATTTPTSTTAANNPAAAVVKRTTTSARPNILLRVLQRERTGYLSARTRGRSNQQRLVAVPDGLSFCLQDIVPYCYLTGHVFMGLTVCGQFLLSYKVTVVETNDFSQFSIGSYKYEIFFWIYRPHQLLRKYYSRCLFDDHGADNEVTVTMCQWLGTPGTLVVHGSCKYDSEDSYVSVLAVPGLGCLDCRRLRDTLHGRNTSAATGSFSDATNASRSAVLCIRCNLSVHTKYTRAESDPPFEPRINLNCPERLILYANGLIHMLNVRLEVLQPQRTTLRPACLDERYVKRRDDDGIELRCPAVTTVVTQPVALPSTIVMTQNVPTPTPPALKPADIIAQIIADFDDCETSSTTSSTASWAISASAMPATPRPLMTTKYFEELVINTLPTAGPPTSGRSARTAPATNNSRRWITRLAAVTSPPKVPTASEATATAASTANAYDFSDEPPERYEKISSFRKRRLADKKYEFSEDNSENIIPFAKLRMRRQNIMMGGIGGGGVGIGGIITATSPHNSLGSSGGGGSPSTGVYATVAENAAQPHSHRASPSHGFRSPCGSPVGGNRFSIMSPPMSVVAASMYGRSPTYKPFGSSPRYLKRFGDSGDPATPVPRTIYSPMLLSPSRSSSTSNGVDGSDFEVFRLGTNNATQPLAEVKPSNIFNSAGPAAQTPIVDQLPAKDGTVATLAHTTAATAAGEDASASDQPLCCAKKLVRRFVEELRPHVDDNDDEDDRTSVMTADEDDDCISPGFHTSLPVEVHGSGCAPMKPVSANGLQQHRQRHEQQVSMAGTATTSAAVVITQHTFDLETLTYHIANHLCTLHDKQYGSFYDWACEPIHICPLSAVLVSLLLVNFTARDATQPGAEPCLNCANGDRLDCAFHRRHFEARSLFTWDVCTGDWCVVDYGTLAELPVSVQQRRQQRRSGGSGASGGGDGAATDSSDGAPRATGIASGAATNAAAEDLAACARRLAVDMQQATAPPSIGSNRRKRAATGGEDGANGGAADRHVDVSWSMAGLHTLDSCTERSKEFLRDQFNAIEFVRGAGADLHATAVPLYRMASMSSASSSSDNSDWE